MFENYIPNTASASHSFCTSSELVVFEKLHGELELALFNSLLGRHFQLSFLLSARTDNAGYANQRLR